MTESYERIAVTGLGIVSALGLNAHETFERVARGERGLSRVSLFDGSGLRSSLVAEVPGLLPADAAAKGCSAVSSRSDVMAALAADEALASARLTDETPLCIATAGSTSGMFEAEPLFAALRAGLARPARELQGFPLSATLERLSERCAPVAHGITVCSACSSGAVAILEGALWLLAGRAERVLAGGTDGLCRLTLAGFNALGATDPDGCRPFDVDRAGMTLGEGAAYLVLERESSARARSAPILAFLTGYAAGAEAHHITHPEPSGAVAASLIEQALAHAGLTPADIDYVNAHGTGTSQNDAMEGRALSNVLGDEAERVYVSSTKGQIGHTLAAAGAIEAALSVLALGASVVVPTGGLLHPDPAIRLRHVLRAEPARLRAVLSTSFGFGGTGCVLAFEHAESAPRRRDASRPPRIVVSGLGSAGPLGVQGGLDHASYAEGSLDEPAAAGAVDPVALLDAERSRRFDRLTGYVTLAAERALSDAGLAPRGVALVAGSAYGNVERSVGFVARIAERGLRAANPAEFPHLVPSAASGNASIYAGFTGPVVTVADVDASADAALQLALSFVESGLVAAAVAGAAEAEDAVCAALIAPACRSSHGAVSAIPRLEGGAFVAIERADSEREGRRVLAEIREFGCVRTGSALTVAPPTPGARALVLTALVAETAQRAMSRSSWCDVPIRSVLARSGSHEAASAFALAAAAALVARGELDEALVCQCSNEQTYFTVVVRPGGA
jgi:3-oxoacyl-[acyl-carrier-protein] synthase II